MAIDLETLAASYRSQEVSGKELADMVTAGTLTSKQRRKIVRLGKKPIKSSTETTADQMTERQKLRLAVKEKKALPKLSKDERRQKFLNLELQKKEEEREKESANFIVCLGCRKRGHYLKDCPKAGKPSTNSDEPVTDICFNCGESGHALRHCSKPRKRDGSLPFASCFICKRKGHISKDCPENPNGLYPKGGCCHICLQKSHLVRDCPERTEEDREQFALKKKRLLEEEEDREKGPRVAGLVTKDGAHGDDIDIHFGTGVDDDDDGDGTTKEKKKKDKKSSKKRKL